MSMHHILAEAQESKITSAASSVLVDTSRTAPWLTCVSLSIAGEDRYRVRESYRELMAWKSDDSPLTPGWIKAPRQNQLL